MNLQNWEKRLEEIKHIHVFVSNQLKHNLVCIFFTAVIDSNLGELLCN